MKQDFADRTIKEKTYPDDDAPWTSPALTAVRRIAEHMRGGTDATLTQTRPLEILSIEDNHGAKQFEGDPKDLRAHPPLFDRDVLAILPFQINARKFVIPYYVMTRDIKRDLKEEEFTVTLKGIGGNGAKVSAFDPIANASKKATVLASEGETIKVQLQATDYPVLLEIEEAGK